MKNTTKTEIKDYTRLALAQILLAIGLLGICAVNAKADTVKKNGLQACKTMSIQPMQNGLVVADMVDNYSIADYEKAIVELDGKEFTTYSNNGDCTVRYSITKTTEQKLKDNEPIIMGVRGASIPVSYEFPKGSKEYMGLAVDVCKSVIDDIKSFYPNATYKFVEVTSSNRIPYLNEGKIDMECGSTTANTPRTNGNNTVEGVNFSTPYYWANVVAVTRADNKLKDLYEIKPNTRLIYTQGTTTEKAIERFSVVFKQMNQNGQINKVVGKDHDESFDLLTQNKGDLFANDDILIYGLIAKSADRNLYKILPNPLSIEPYAVMTRKDDKWFTLQVNKSINGTMRSGRFDGMYAKWFMQSIPPFNKALDVKMSYRLRETVRMPNNILGD